MASSDVAARSAWPWTSASAAPGSARVVLTVASRASRVKRASASAPPRGEYAGGCAGPAFAVVSVWSRMMSRGIRSPRPVLRAWRRIPGPPRDPVKARLLRLYRALLAHHGPQGWWPARTPFEVAVGAILTQHTAWSGAAQAVAALRARGLLV